MVDTYGGQESLVYFITEGTYGTTPTTPAMISIDAQDFEPQIDPGLLKVMGVGSRDPQALLKGLRNPQLQLTHILPSVAPINFIQHITTLNSLSVQVLYFKGLFASATDIISLLYTGCKLDKISVQCSMEDIIKATCTLLGQNIVVGTSKITGATYGDYIGGVPFYNAPVSHGAGDGSSLSDIGRVTDWKFEIQNNLKPVAVCQAASSSVLLKCLQPKRRVLSGELTFEFESKSEFDDVVNDSEFSLKFGLGGTNNALFKYCKWDKVSSPTKNEDLVSLKASFTSRDTIIAAV